MAKLHDQVTPAQMLEEIRNGALKGELIKKYRTTEQEMAMMLLPLYRSGELSKEEFNDFFKGVALRKPAADSEPAKEAAQPATNNDEPPSQIFKALTDKLRPRPPKPQPAAEPEPMVAEEPEAKEISPQEEAPAPAPAFMEPTEEPVAAAGAPVLEPVPEEPPFPEPVPETVLLKPESEEAQASTEAPETPSVLDSILARLDSIDARLAEIEKKLPAA